MKVFKVELTIEEKENFNENMLKEALVKNFKEVNLKLLKFEYTKDAEELLMKKLSRCELIIEYKEFSVYLPYHQIVLGGINEVEKWTGLFKIHSAKPSLVEFDC